MERDAFGRLENAMVDASIPKHLRVQQLRVDDAKSTSSGAGVKFPKVETRMSKNLAQQ